MSNSSKLIDNRTKSQKNTNTRILHNRLRGKVALLEEDNAEADVAITKLLYNEENCVNEIKNLRIENIELKQKIKDLKNELLNLKSIQEKL